MNIINKCFALCVLFSFVNKPNASSLELELGALNKVIRKEAYHYAENYAENSKEFKLGNTLGIAFDSNGMNENKLNTGIRLGIDICKIYAKEARYNHITNEYDSDDKSDYEKTGYDKSDYEKIGFVAIFFAGTSLNFRPFSSVGKLRLRVYPGICLSQNILNNNNFFLKIGLSVCYDISKNLYSFISLEKNVFFASESYGKGFDYDAKSSFSFLKFGIAINRTIK
ncbi:hypothetical protein [Candidatus Nesciobacter abundans]|uniref:Uncharacterized protein n=1 Tax=Candidatus Nesciobacter abundans TaxID=2601668 RepID=A0A5C0UGH2_9PROT|nr:hypothetical protein [Candidatus Nesciobacter abundans]QEK39168.1 hypothetical protein FZC36_01845 [Candidatus Nesciobacter abundans]